jgi:uncharacterized protein
MLEDAGNLDNMRLAAGLPTSARRFRAKVFMDSDIYKWLEAVAWEFGRSQDKRAVEEAEQAISLIEQAQQPDGSLNSHFQTTVRDRYTDFTEGHELYCAGHLTQAAVAWTRAVGDDRLLGVARSFIDHLCDRFLDRGEEGAAGPPRDRDCARGAAQRDGRSALSRTRSGTAEPKRLRTARAGSLRLCVHAGPCAGA